MADATGILHQTKTINVPTLATSTTISADNPARSAFMIQNQAAAKLYICFGGTASSSVYHVILKAGTGTEDGTGGTFAMEDGTIFTGVITCYASGTPSYTLMECS